MYRIVLMLCIILFSVTSTQTKENIVGTWQYENNHIADGFNHIYRFYSNGKFIFRFSSMSDFGKRIIGVRGNYDLNDEYIIFNIECTEERVGGEIVPGDGTVDNVGWILAKSEIKLLKQETSTKDTLEYKLRENDKIKILTIDVHDFYHINDDPDYLNEVIIK